MSPSKLRLLMAVLARNPPEFVDRLRAIGEVNADRLFHRPPPYPAVPWDDIMDGLSRALNVDASAFDREIERLELDRIVADGVARTGPAPALTLRHNADARVARLCYIACRARRPQTVVETGVAYGVTTTFVLSALEANGAGQLHSIDLPPLGREAGAAVGAFVPDRLRARWTLHRGSSRRLLPPLLARIGPVDLFIHDSLHTSATMRREFALADHHRRDPFVLVSDDIESNSAFSEYVSDCGGAVAFAATCAASAKDARAGLCIASA